MPTVESTSVSRAGITTSSNGDRHIPSSVRADGSVRKEIRVRPGYRPPEDVEIYKNRTAEGFRNRGKGGVPGAEDVRTAEDSTKTSAASNKNAKRREARRKAAAASHDTDSPSEPSKTEATAISHTQAEPQPSDGTSSKEPEKLKDPEAEKKKEAKKLWKKLRQARELKDKKDKGDKLLPEQFDKVIKISELIRQLENLGFDAHGDKKDNS